MNWIIENLETLATLGSAFAVYIFIRKGAKKDIIEIEKRLDKIDERFDKMDARFDKVEEKLQILDSRISRIEGQLSSPSYFEPKVKEK